MKNNMMVSSRCGDYVSPKSEIVEVLCERGLCLSNGDSDSGDLDGLGSVAHW